MTLREHLVSIGACDEALAWIGDRTAIQAWEECRRLGWMIWWAGRTGANSDAAIWAAWYASRSEEWRAAWCASRYAEWRAANAERCSIIRKRLVIPWTETAKGTDNHGQ